MLELIIRDLVVEGTHGVYAHEKVKPQRFKISVRIFLKATEPNKTDDLNDTVSWSDVRKNIINTVHNTSFNLVERLAEEIAFILLQDKRISKLIVSIDKVDAYSDCVPCVKLSVSAK